MKTCDAVWKPVDVRYIITCFQTASHLFLQHFSHNPEKMWCCCCSWFPLKQVRWWSMLGGNQAKCQLPSRKNSFMTCNETSGKLSGRGNSLIYEIYLGVAEIQCRLAWLLPCPLFKIDFETVRLHSCDARLEGWRIAVHFSQKNHPHSKMRNVPDAEEERSEASSRK